MRIFGIEFGRKASDPLAIWAEMLRAGRSSKAGPTINLDNALKVATLFACLRVLAQGCAQVPFKLFQGYEPAREHPLYDLMASGPNDWTTSFEFRESLVIHAALGNAYVFKNMVGLRDKRPGELILLNPGKVKKLQDEKSYEIGYEVTGASGAKQIFPAEAIWHVRGPSWDGLIGMEILSIAREALGLSIATEESHAKLHANGVRTSGTYSVDSVLNKTQYTDLKAWIEKEYAGAENAGAPMILDRAAKWLPNAMTGVDAQHIETRKHQIEEICRFVGVHPQKVFHSDKTSTYASAEEFSNAHREDTLGPWYARIEQSADKNLLTKKDRADGYYFKFVANALMRASAQARAEYYAKALGSGGHPGWMSPDEVRALEDMAPKGGDADKLPPGANKEPPAA
jgi:HK97 family phage portal protein